MRESGSSHVTPMTALEFLKRLVNYKLGPEMARWRENSGVEETSLKSR
jgi:hypothetical protein